MTELLQQRPSGHLYVATDDLRKRKDMYPYDPGPKVKEQSQQPREEISTQEAEIRPEGETSTEIVSGKPRKSDRKKAK